MKTRIVSLGFAAFAAFVFSACEDARNGSASTQCRATIAAARSNMSDLSVACRACCLEKGAARGLMKTTECDCVGRAANSGLDREQQ